MSKEIVTRSHSGVRRSGPHKEAALSFQERLRQSLGRPSQATRGGQQIPSTSCLLLDLSGSMRWPIGHLPRPLKIDELRILADNFKDVRRFVFSTNAEELGANESIGEPYGGTAMDVAFMAVKKVGIDHVVMITDGMPDHEGRAIEAAKGLRIDVFYVGPDPAPQFLRDLAAQTGGEYGKATLEARPALEAKVRLMLPAGGGGK